FGTSEGDLKRLSAAEAPLELRLPLLGPPGSAVGTHRLLARLATTDAATGQLTVAPCSAVPGAETTDRGAPAHRPDPGAPSVPRMVFDVSSGSARDVFQEIPWRVGAGRTICLAIERSPNVKVEGIAVVPAAEELPPPPPEPWEPPPAELPTAAPIVPRAAPPH
ncbi:MAG: hypothetical protein ABW133_09405, partial [Polyangiaceae bacterium]